MVVVVSLCVYEMSCVTVIRAPTIMAVAGGTNKKTTILSRLLYCSCDLCVYVCLLLFLSLLLIPLLCAQKTHKEKGEIVI